MKIYFLLIALILSNQLIAADVIKKRKNKKIIVINEGKNSGISKGDKICFYKPTGKKVGCGKVQKVKKTKAYVKVSKSRFKKIKKGYSTEGSKSSYSSKSGNKGIGLYVKANYIASPLASGSYNKMIYNTPYQGEILNSLWDTDGVGGSSFVGFGGELGYYLILGYLVAGGKYKMISPANIDSNYSQGQDNPALFARTSTSASSIGFYFDALYPVIQNRSMIVNVGGGLDIDMNSVTVISEQLNDDAPDEVNPILNLDSSAMFISLRLRAEFNYKIIDNLFVNAAGVGLIGVTGTPSVTVDVPDPNVSSLNPEVDPQEDAVLALNHTAGFGVEIIIGISYYL